MEDKNILEQKKDLDNRKILNKKVDIFGENNIIEKSKKITLKQLSAIYFWQKNLNKSEPLVDYKKIIEIIKKYSTEEIFEKVLNLEKVNIEYVENLIFEIELIYSEKDKHKLDFDIESFIERLDNNNLEKKIAEAQKKNDLKSLIILSRKKDGY